MISNKHVSSGINSAALRRMDYACKAFSVLAVILVASPYTYTLLFSYLARPVTDALLLTAGSICAGYGLMWIYGSVRHMKKNVLAANSYETLEPYFQIEYALLPGLICLISIFPVAKIVHKVLDMRYEAGIGAYYGRTSLVPAFITVFIIVLSGIGIALWFFPFNHLISIRTFIPFITALLANLVVTALFTGVTERGGTVLFVIFCLIGYLVCALPLLNQGTILRHYTASRASIITAGARRYNFGLTVGSLLLIVLAMFLSVTLLTGVMVIGKLLLVAVLSAILGEGKDAYSGSSASDSASRGGSSPFEGVADITGAGTDVSKVFFVIFVLLAVFGILFFFLFRRPQILSAIREILRRLYGDLCQFFADLLSLGRSRRARSEIVSVTDYKDEEIRMDMSNVREYLAPTRRVLHYADFERQLQQLPDRSSQFQYAYHALLSAWKSDLYGIESSDTPRQIMKKVLAKSSAADLPAITGIFEQIRYAERPLEDMKNNENADSALDSVCRLLRRYYS